MFDTIVTGYIQLPENVRCIPKDASVTIALQDTSRVDRPAIDISILSMTVGTTTTTTRYRGGGMKGKNTLLSYSIPFCLYFNPSLKMTSSPNASQEHDWYTLRVKIESKEGALLCFNNRIVKALDQCGKPQKDIKVNMIAPATRFKSRQ